MDVFLQGDWEGGCITTKRAHACLRRMLIATGKSDANKSTPSNDEEGCVASSAAAAAAANKSGNVPSPTTPPLLTSATTGTSSTTPASTPPSESVSPTQQQQQRSSSSFAASAAAGPNPMLPTVDLTTTTLGGGGGGGGASHSSSLAIKILVSNNVAGSIIGRSGQTINELQEQSASRIKLSQSGDCYPGTTDRVCLIQGTPANVKTATGLVLQKTYESQQQQGQIMGNIEAAVPATPLSSNATSAGTGVASHASQTPSSSSPGKSGSSRYVQTDSSNKQKQPMSGNNNPSSRFLFVVRILVPIPSCGMLIGRGGTNIKYMLEVSGVSSIRLSRKEGDINNMRPSSSYNMSSSSGGGGSSSSSTTASAVLSATSERVVTISGPSLESCISCVSVILDGMAAHPEISRYVNMSTSYSRAVSAAQSAIGAAQAAAAVQGGRIGSHPPHSSPSTPSSGPITIPGYALGSPPTEPPTLGRGGGLQPGPSMGMVQQGPGRMILTQQQQQQQHHHPQHSMNRGMLSVTEGLRGPLSPSSRFFESRMSSESSANAPGPPGSFPIGSSPSSSIATGTTTSTAVTSATTHQQPHQQQQQPTSTASSVVPVVAAPTAHPPRTSSSSLYESSPFMEQPQTGGASIQGTWHPDFAASPTATATTTSGIIPPSSPPSTSTAGGGGGGPGRSSWGSSSAAAAAGIVGTSPPAQGQAPPLLQNQQQQQHQQQHARNLATDQNLVAHYPHAAHNISGASSFEQQQQQQQPSAQMAIPDVLIGSILGRGGRTLHQLQLASNCRIRISQRGVFVPGTVNRVVTMTGPTAESVSAAQFLIRQRLMEHNQNQMGNAAYNATKSNAPPASVPPTPPSTPIVEQHTNYHHHHHTPQSHHRASPQQQQQLQQHHQGGGYLNYAPMHQQQQQQQPQGQHDPRYLSHGSAAGTRDGGETDAPEESSPASDPNLPSTSTSQPPS
eukprot:scaffold103139_cov48-Attheya_sp.AAC.1